MHELSAHEVAKAGASSLSKLALSAGSTAGALWEGRMLSCGWGWCEPILVGGLTYIGRHRDLYSFVVGAI
ncbi:hypothetical protein HMPREF3185_01060 [Porphyromonas somerae]|uniref:Uncharacterized protein n=1 Tax=Porphyromonas somerae TaxID=322095 RepID=A0A134B866_9PORP|nr:hypothetical protein HMPREF3184_01060 [Porphyromonadaceae bacterium KA00676]KXB76123.1 hypothetical protein HMPREF3185_01060 [Porphyromonas somerae]